MRERSILPAGLLVAALVFNSALFAAPAMPPKAARQIILQPLQVRSDEIVARL
jgi:hypothetical protein